VSGLAELGAPEVLRPRLSAREGVRVSSVSLDDDALLFRAEGEVTPGIWREPRARGGAGGGEAVLLFADGSAGEGGVLLEPRRAGVHVVAKRATPAGAPSATSQIAVLVNEGAPLVVAGHSVGVSADGSCALVLDLAGKRARRVDLSSLDVDDVGELDGGMDPQLAPLVALDESGAEALFMDAREERCDASLEGLDLATGERTRLLGPLPAPARVVGAFAPDDGGVLVVETRLGDQPSSRVTLLAPSGERELWRGEVTQPASVPAFLDARTALLPLSLAPHPMSTYGPVDLVALGLDGKAPMPLTHSGDVSGTVRLAGERVLVEGGDRVWLLAPKS
jgi:hypothetical protein